MKYKKYKDPFKPMHKAAIGIAGLGVITAVGSGIAAHAPAGTPSLTGGFSTIASFAPIAVTASVGKSLLPKTKYKY